MSGHTWSTGAPPGALAAAACTCEFEGLVCPQPPTACLHCSVPAGKREAEATAAAATIAGGEVGEGAKRRRTDEAAGMEVVEPHQVCTIR